MYCQGELGRRYKKKKRKCVCSCVCAAARSLLNYLAALYLHGVCFSRGGLTIGKDSPIVSTEYIYNGKKNRVLKTEKKAKMETMWKEEISAISA